MASRDEIVSETFLGGSDSEIEVFGGDVGKGGIGVTRRRVENGRIYVIKRRVWGMEELARRER